jgi:hypothetical protein
MNTNVPNGHKISQMSVNIPMARKYINIFQSKALRCPGAVAQWTLRPPQEPKATGLNPTKA